MTSAPGQPNQHIREYLTHYLNFEKPLHYAVLLDGAWGIGKTHLILEILTAHYKDKKDEYVYLSLFGLTTTEEIDAALIAALYPILNHKAAKTSGKVIKAGLSVFGVDADFKSGDFLSSKAKVYIFDDLERCEMPPNKVLGYINGFVEHDDGKVLIIANQKEIVEEVAYLRQREKLIGKTLEIESSFDQAFTNFRLNLSDADARDFVEKNAAEVAMVFNQSKLENLRILQQTLWDFERLYQAFTAKHRANTAAMIALLRMFFALSFELKAGRITEKDIERRSSGIGGALRALNNKADPTPLEKSGKHYPAIDLGDSILSNAVLNDALARGVINKELIHESLDRSPYFHVGSEQPAWRIVWYGIDHTDTDFNYALQEMNRQYLAREFVILGEILHVLGLQLWLSDIGAIQRSRAKVVKDGIQYIDELYDAKKLSLESASAINDDLVFGYGGLEVNNKDTKEFKQMHDHLKGKLKQAIDDSYPDQAKELLKEMESDSESYFKKLCVTFDGNSIYARVPILAKTHPKEFVNTVLKQSPANQKNILMVFRTRYQGPQPSQPLIDEKEWLQAVRTLLLSEAKSMPAIGKYRIKKHVEWFIDPWFS